MQCICIIAHIFIIDSYSFGAHVYIVNFVPVQPYSLYMSVNSIIIFMCIITSIVIHFFIVCVKAILIAENDHPFIAYWEINLFSCMLKFCTAICVLSPSVGPWGWCYKYNGPCDSRPLHFTIPPF